LPQLDVELQKLLKETESQLGKLPKAPSDDAQGEIILLVSGFARELATYVEGTPEDNGIHQLIRPLNNKFLTAIGCTAQRFCPFEKGLPVYASGPSVSYITVCANVGTPVPKSVIPDVERTIYRQNEDDEVICVDEVTEMANR
jgi:hypothetical protein